MAEGLSRLEISERRECTKRGRAYNGEQAALKSKLGVHSSLSLWDRGSERDVLMTAVRLSSKSQMSARLHLVMGTMFRRESKI